MKNTITPLAALGLACLLAACGGGGGGAGPGPANAGATADLGARPAATRSDTGPGDADRHWPTQLGDTWLYDVHTTGDAEGAGVSWSSAVTVVGSEAEAGLTRVWTKEAPNGDDGKASRHAYFIDRGGVTYLPSVTPEGATHPLLQQQGEYRGMLFALKEGERFLAFDDKGLDAGEDVDGDGKPETVDLRMTVTFLGFEPVAVPAGAFPRTAKYERRLAQRTTLSRNGEQRDRTTVATLWYASGVGPVRMTVDTSAGGEAPSGSVHELKAYTVGGVSVGSFVFLPPVSTSSGYHFLTMSTARWVTGSQVVGGAVGSTDAVDPAHPAPAEAPASDPNR